MPASNVFNTGRALHSELIRAYGPCWVTSVLWDLVYQVDVDVWAWFKDRLFWKHGIPVPGPNPCLSCPSFEVLEIAILGGLVTSGFPIAEEIRQHVGQGPEVPLVMDPARVAEEMLKGVALGIEAFRAAVAGSVDDVRPLLRSSQAG